jgi:hypothetical protein
MLSKLNLGFRERGHVLGVGEPVELVGWAKVFVSGDV